VRFWNIGDDALKAALRSARIADLEIETGRNGGVALYWKGYFLGVWVEFRLGQHDFVPAAHLLATFSGCDRREAVAASRDIAQCAAAEVPVIRAWSGERRAA
jgi:hypothetical protein